VVKKITVIDTMLCVFEGPCHGCNGKMQDIQRIDFVVLVQGRSWEIEHIRTFIHATGE
jgi:hypothetical protein